MKLITAQVVIITACYVSLFSPSTMIRSRNGLTRTVLNKIDKDRKLAAMDKSKWYKIDERQLQELSPEIFRKFQILTLDEETVSFLDKCIENSDNLCWQIYVNLATSILSWFMSPTSINGFLGRGSMQVFSKSQFESVIDWKGEVKESLLDIGAGDGATTSQMSPYFAQVFVTEMSSSMKRVLTQKGFKVLDEKCWHEDEVQYDMISCLNVLDRCDEPMKLLDQMRQKLLRPHGTALVSFVIPFEPYVEFESKTHEPKELLPIKGTSFEVEVVNFVEKVLKPSGWELIKWSRVPYLCDGDIHQAYYWLDDALFLIRPID